MAEFSIYYLLFLALVILPFITCMVKPPKSDLMSLVGHFIKWYALGFAGFVIILAIGSNLPHKEEDEKAFVTPISQPMPAQKGLELI